MKKFVFLFAVFLLYSHSINAADVNLKDIDAASRLNQPNSNSIMFRRNSEQYQQLSDEQREEIKRQREIARQQMLEYERQKAEYEARLKAQQEEERRRAEALKPIKLYENKLKIYALVNGEVITSSDMQSRINAFILTTGIPYNAKTKSMITNKVLQTAIDEKLKIQEANKNKINVTRQELKNAVTKFEKSNNMPKGQLQKILSQADVRMSVWTKQIEADLAWKKLISNKSVGRISISENDIKRAFDDIKKDMTTPKYMLSEIVINKKEAKDIKELADILRQDPRFELYAMQFSQSPSAANGGHLGWIIKGKLPKTLEDAALKLKEGEVSAPIIYGSDYYILKMEKVFNPKTDAKSLPEKKQVKAFLENKKLEEFSNKYLKDLRNRALIEKKI